MLILRLRNSLIYETSDRKKIIQRKEVSAGRDLRRDRDVGGLEKNMKK